MDTKDEEAVRGSKIQTNCFAKSALAIDRLYGRGKLLDIPTIMQELIDGAKKITDGNTKEIEQMLFTHAKTLDYIFYDALSQLADCQIINQIEVFSNIAFRAQNQSRKALLALAELKNPRRATFIKQQNNAVNQQINNSEQDNLKEFKKYDKVANELLELNENEQWMDKATQGTPIKNDPSMEALGAFDGCKDKRRQGYKQDE